MRAPLVALVVLAAVAALPTAPTAATDAAVHGTAMLRFSGSSTLHGFSGTAAPTTFVLEPSLDGTWAAVLDVPIAGLTTDNEWRDSSMRTMLGGEAHPTIRGSFTGIVPTAVETSGRLPFRLGIAGTERALVADVSAWQQSGDRAEFDAAFDVSLSAFGLKAPRTLFIRVDDTVRVEIHVALIRR